MTTQRMPALFLAHGNPMNAIADNDFTNVRGLYSLLTGSSLTTSACSKLLDNEISPLTGTINISTQSGAAFSGSGALFFSNGGVIYRLAITPSGSVAGAIIQTS